MEDREVVARLLTNKINQIFKTEIDRELDLVQELPISEEHLRECDPYALVAAFAGLARVSDVLFNLKQMRHNFFCLFPNYAIAQMSSSTVLSHARAESDRLWGAMVARELYFKYNLSPLSSEKSKDGNKTTLTRFDIELSGPNDAKVRLVGSAEHDSRGRATARRNFGTEVEGFGNKASRLTASRLLEALCMTSWYQSYNSVTDLEQNPYTELLEGTVLQPELESNELVFPDLPLNWWQFVAKIQAKTRFEK